MIFDLTNEEATHLINTLGDLPTRTNVFPIAVKLQQQAQFQDQLLAGLNPNKEGTSNEGGANPPKE